MSYDDTGDTDGDMDYDYNNIKAPANLKNYFCVYACKVKYTWN